MPEAHTYPLPGAANDTWRAWLMTGVRREQGDRRRIRGSHLGLKRMLVEGMKVRVDRPYSWKELSDALVRQAVGDAVRSLPRADADLVKLAYFGGMSNREIAKVTGRPESTIERRLRRAISTIARFVEHGRGLGQRALGAVLVWLGGSWFHEAVLPAAQATAVAGMAAVLIAQAPSGTPPSGADSPAVPGVSTTTFPPPSHATAPPLTTQPEDQQAAAAAPAASLPAPPAQVTAPQLPLSVPIPALPLPAAPVNVPAPRL